MTTTADPSSLRRPVLLALIASVVVIGGLVVGATWTSWPLKSTVVSAGGSQIYVAIYRNGETIRGKMSEIRWMSNGWSSDLLMMETSKIRPEEISFTKDPATGNVVIRIGDAEWVADLTRHQVLPSRTAQLTSN